MTNVAHRSDGPVLTLRLSLTIAVLFAREDSIYKTLPGCDVWDEARDALRFPGGMPVVAHPPCRAWGRLRTFANSRPGEKDLARWAVAQVREWGGVLEHPAGSILWDEQGLPKPRQRDEYGGWTLPIVQMWWGHKAEKKTWLYIVGCEPKAIPPMPMKLGEATHVIQSRKRHDYRPHVTKAEREHTPKEMAEWLVELALRCARPRLSTVARRVAIIKDGCDIDAALYDIRAADGVTIRHGMGQSAAMALGVDP